MSQLITRTFPIDDINVEPDGTGRTVIAYVTPFDQSAEVRDQDGHYNEQIARTAFDKSIAEVGTRVGVFYNHGKTLYGTPSERFSMPLGTPLEIKADGRGLLTRTRYNKTPLADEVLEAINNGDIRGQSFTGRILQSDPQRGPYRSRAGGLTLVTRKEIKLKEYGPTPFPVYVDAAIVGVRAEDLVDRLREAGAVDLDDISDEDIIRLVRSTTVTQTEGTATPPGPAAGEPGSAEAENHSRPALDARVMRARLRKMGVLK
jgi:HK97 family phage prohead protease